MKKHIKLVVLRVIYLRKMNTVVSNKKDTMVAHRISKNRVKGKICARESVCQILLSIFYTKNLLQVG